MNRLNQTYSQTNIYAQHCGVDTGNPSSGKEKDSETGLSYFGARYYEPEMLNVWLSVDPMADKYPNMSPYNYCAWTRPTGGDEHRWIKYNIVNNPVKLVDLDGCKFDTTGTFSNDEQRQTWGKAIEKLCEDKVCKKRYQQLLCSKTVYKIILINDGDSRFRTTCKSEGENTLYWDPSASIKCENGTILPPFLVLDHEFGHMERADNVYRLKSSMDKLYKEYKNLETNTNRDAYQKARDRYIAAYYSLIEDRGKGSDPIYGSKEERRNIENVEWVTARRFGIIGENKVTRTSHRGTVVHP